MPSVKVRNIRVATILRNCEHSYDFQDNIDWERVIENKSSNPHFSRLVDDIIENGIKEPIMYNVTTKTIGNGHHRFVAAILLGLDTVPTTGVEWWPEDWA